jgi:hypothetical protein
MRKVSKAKQRNVKVMSKIVDRDLWANFVVGFSCLALPSSNADGFHVTRGSLHKMHKRI